MSEVRDVTDNFHTPNYRRMDRVFVKGKGSTLFDEEGTPYLDFLTGISVTLLGHSHPDVVAAVVDQSKKLFHVSNLFYVPSQASLLKELVPLFPWKGRVFFCNSGSEAVEGAIKLARKCGKERGGKGPTIISFRGSFHGRTYGSLSATAQEKYHAGFEPMLPGFAYVTPGDRAGFLSALEGDVCALIFEPVQGEGGVLPFEKEFLRFVCEEAEKREILIISDEIQCGMGRTGKFFAFEHYGIFPHIITMAKGIANGLPLGVVAASEDVAAYLTPGSHGSTFGGNPVSCSAATETVRIVKEPSFLEGVREKGEFLKNLLEGLSMECQGIEEVRGMGLMWGVVLSRPGKGIVERCLEERLIINCTEERVLRLLPPLNVKRNEIKNALEIMKKVLKEEFR